MEGRRHEARPERITGGMVTSMTYEQKTERGRVLYAVRQGKVVILLEQPRMCPGCRVMMHVAVNRMGLTRCVGCDGHREAA